MDMSNSRVVKPKLMEKNEKLGVTMGIQKSSLLTNLT